MKHLIPARIKALQAGLSEMGLDAAMIYDRENLIYFAGVDDLEGGALAVPAEGEPALFCLWMEREYIQDTSGIGKVIPFVFPESNQSKEMGKWLKGQGFMAPRLGFTRYFVSLNDYLLLREASPDMAVCDIALLCYKIRSIKSPEEIQRIKTASGILKAGMDAAFAAAAPGVRETDVLAEAEYAMLKAGSFGPPFRMQVLTGSRQQLMHPYSGDALLEPDAPVVINLGASYKGYVSKMCRTVFLGNPKKQSVDIYKTLIKALDAAVTAVKPGMTCAALYDIVWDILAEAGYEKYWVMEIIGHGIGIRQTEFYPVLAKGNDTALEKNMVINLLLPTVYMKGAGGPKITDTILIGEDGGQRLTDYPSDAV